ncbi:MAG: M14 family metallopeptidase [Balneolaceae bacterium]|nr:M14 family metallopeptidase [Balneolaceae bacterium]
MSVLLFFTGCKSSEYKAYVYDPVGATLTEDKSLDPYHRRTIAFAEDGVWFTNEFSGARLNDVIRVAPYEYELLIAAENTPINNSAWYSFVVGRGGVQGLGSAPGLGGAREAAAREVADSLDITLRLTYQGGGHRYRPHILERVESGSGATAGAGTRANETATYIVRQIDSVQTSTILHPSTNNPGLEIRVSLSRDPVLITAQRLETSTALQDTLHAWQTAYPSVHLDTAGSSTEGRPIPGLTISQNPTVKRPTLMVIGRQHPPEVPGYEVMRSFLRRFAADDSLADTFRESFHVVALPMANPDGVDRGHWRHNARGVDLNRDWIKFNQQETQVARRYFQEKAATLGQPVYAIDFHSTQIHLMYPIDESIPLDGPAISAPWFEHLLAPSTGYPFEVAIEPFDTSGPVAKNWFWRAFGIDALTYEVSDLSTPAQNDKAGKIAAESLMETLLETLD